MGCRLPRLQEYGIDMSKENESKAQRGSAALAVKAGFWYVVSNFLVKALSFLTTPIFSRLMSEADYGEFSNYASWQTTLLIITGAELHNTLGPAYYDYKDNYDQYVSTVTIFSCLLTAAFYALFLLCGDWIYNIVAIPREFVHVLFFTLMCQACKAVYLARERTLYRYKSVAMISVITLVVPTLIALAFVLMADESDRLAARIYGQYVPLALIGLVCASVMLLRGKSFRLDQCKYALKLSLPLLVHYLTAYLLTSTNTIVTKSVMGAEAAAVISIATSAIHILTILLQALTGALTTWMMDNLDQGKVDTVRKGSLLYVAGIAVVCIGVMLLAPELIWILGGSKYAEATTLMPGMVAAAMIQSVTTLFTIILTYRKNVVKTAAYTTVVAGVSILVKILLLPELGVQVLPYVNAVAFVALYLVDYWLVYKGGDGSAVNFKVTSAIIVVTCLAILPCFYLYEHTVIRYGVICVAVVAALALIYKHRDLVINLLKSKLKKKSK